ncbi:MAG: polyphosphate glucokinase [Proteobacteria bacterium]|nr:polyphosphate glucokinase [Pseudomonadota bacterium]
MNKALGIDVGGTGIKGAIVNIDKGVLHTERHRIETPQPATPQAVAQTVAQIAEHFQWTGSIGCGFPAAVQQGIVRTAANIDKSWIGADGASLFSEATGQPVFLLNDADAAGMAEMRFGAGKDSQGVVMMITLGTGIGTALFTDGTLLPNTELGHLRLGELSCEQYASNAIRKKEDLNWEQWGTRLNEVLCTYHALFWPKKFIIGGGVSKKNHKFFKHLNVPAELVVATQKNEAGIIGAAVHAFERSVES